jgi:hypothetical protein
VSPLDRHGNYYPGDEARPDAALASAARTSSAAGSAFNTAQADSFEGFLSVTAATALTSLDVRLETSVDAGTSWTTVAAFAQVTASPSTKNRVFGPLGDSCRWAWTLVGTSVTFAVAVEANN